MERAEGKIYQDLPPVDDGSTGIEIEDLSGGIITESGIITEPFDPTKIRVNTKSMTIDLVLKRIRENALDLSSNRQRSSFQRMGNIWTGGAQSRLIESLLIQIPLPAFYIDATDEDNWIVVDGLQRLTALKRFIIEEELKLRELEFLTDLHGKVFSELTPRFRRRIEETQITINTIEEGTPSNAKFNIFKRINTSGLPLSSQEIRHALNQGQATQFLTRLAKSKEFLAATDNSIKDTRRADQECVLRFIAFTLVPYEEYKTEDFDGFLNDTMRHMNQMKAGELEHLAPMFIQAMAVAHKIFGTEAFRKRDGCNERRSPINKALFETWSVNLGRLDKQRIALLVERREMLINKFIDLVRDSDFNNAISFGTKTIKKVNLRFSMVEGIIQEVLSS